MVLMAMLKRLFKVSNNHVLSFVLNTMLYTALSKLNELSSDVEANTIEAGKVIATFSAGSQSSTLPADVQALVATVSRVGQ